MARERGLGRLAGRKKAVQMKKKLFLLIACVSVAAGCSRDGADKGVAPPRVDKDAVIFEAASPQVAALQTASVERQREAVVRFNGRVVWNEDRTVRVFSPFAGRVVSISARAGDRIRPGQTLAVLAAPELGMAQSEARKADQDYALAKKNFARIEELHAAGVSPAKDLQAAQAEVARTAAERSRTLARLKLYGKDPGTEELQVDQQLALRAPIGGVVVERNLNPGQELRPDTQGDKALFVVSDPSKLWFVLDVAEKDLAGLKPGLEVQLGASSLGEQRVPGHILYVADLVDPQTRTVKVRGVVDNSDQRLKAEMFITAELRMPAAKGLLVPSRAIYLRGEQNFVFVDAGGGRYVRKPVRLGPASNSHQLVLAGLEPTDKVVVDGNLLLEKILASKD
jgi:cobalt-zinc-cadmium efflux system membrane fusion protein